MKILWFDTETTGLDPVKNDIIQMAGIFVENGKVLDRFDITCQPFSYETISQEALDTHGISVETLRTFQSPKEAYKQLTALLVKHCDKYDKADKIYLGGQNTVFDKNFLHYFFKKNDDRYFGSWFYHHVLDLMQLTTILRACGRICPENLKLESIAKICRVDLSNAHDALADIEATRQCFVKLCDTFLRTKTEAVL